MAAQNLSSKPSARANGVLAPRMKLVVHIVQIILIHVVLALSAVRLFTWPKGVPRTRATTMALGMSAKSMVFILYQILTEHFRPFKRWASLKANAILNGIEIVTWAAVVYMVIQANTRYCVGTNCILAWVVVALAITLSLLSAYNLVISYLDFRYYRATGMHRGSTLIRNESEDGQSLESVEPPRYQK